MVDVGMARWGQASGWARAVAPGKGGAPEAAPAATASAGSSETAIAGSASAATHDEAGWDGTLGVAIRTLAEPSLSRR
eukprot:9340399-Pyramimonas_sp.AAC.1